MITSAFGQAVEGVSGRGAVPGASLVGVQRARPLAGLGHQVQRVALHLVQPQGHAAGVTLAGAGHCVPAVPEAAQAAVPAGTADALQSSPGCVVQSSMTIALLAADGPLLVTTML